MKKKSLRCSKRSFKIIQKRKFKRIAPELKIECDAQVDESQLSQDAAQGNATESEGSLELWNGPR